VLRVLACIASEKVAVTLAPRRTPVALLAGVVPVTVGGVLSITSRSRPAECATAVWGESSSCLTESLVEPSDLVAVQEMGVGALRQRDGSVPEQ
jgi:hypothetical protein